MGENPSKKPQGKVLSISGEFQQDVIHQSDLEGASQLQAAAWQAEQTAQEAVLRIESRLRNGARFEDGDLVFDEELRMVRTKRQKAGGE